VFDGLNDYRNVAFHIQVGRNWASTSRDSEFRGQPGPHDDYFIGKARELASQIVDTIVIADACGAMLPERAHADRPGAGRVAGDRAHFSIPNGVSTPATADHPARGRRPWGASTPLATAFFPPHATIVQLAREEMRGRPGRAVFAEIDDCLLGRHQSTGRVSNPPRLILSPTNKPSGIRFPAE
jgi:hypothetical protein